MARSTVTVPLPQSGDVHAVATARLGDQLRVS